jgi:drug/metabolite transporter (DMT)-like permease
MPWVWPLPAASTGEWVTLVYLGVCQIAVALIFLTTAIRHLSALEVSLLLLIEPVLNPVWTWIVRGEHPGTWTIVGGGVIVAATALRAINEARPARTPVSH